MIRITCAVVLSTALLSAHAYDWPERTVTAGEMRTDNMPIIKVPVVRERGNVEGPVTVKIHVDPAGDVRRVILFKGSGSPGHDRAVVDAMKRAHFQPKIIDGEPQDVTLIMPVHVPLTRNNPWH